MTLANHVAFLTCFLFCAWRMLSHFSRVQLFVILWTVAHQDPLSTGFSRQEHWNGLPFPSPCSSQSRDWTHIFYVSCIGMRVLYHLCHLGSPFSSVNWDNDKTHILGLLWRFYFIFFYIYLFTWLHWVLVAACRIFSCGMWDLVPWPGIKPGSPALMQRLSHWTIKEVPVMKILV